MGQIKEVLQLTGIHPDAEPGVVGIAGVLSGNDVLRRAQYWADRGIIGGQPDAPDRSGRRYRTDGAGLVSNAWSLAASPTINEILANALHGVANMQAVRLEDLRPGDALVRDADTAGGDGHIALFAFWSDAADPRKGAYVYSFEASGENQRPSPTAFWVCWRPDPRAR